MASTFTVTSISGGNYKDLKEEANNHERRIKQIKSEVQRDWDNINNPVPFLAQA